MNQTKNFTELMVWQKAHELVIAIYEVTKQYSKGEMYGLVSQMRRAAVSVPANIAEGYKRKTVPNKLKYLDISEGSFEEV